jgi:hypothetical protein
MITLNEIAYNIKNLAYGGKSSLESDISLRQIKHWIHYHRAKLVADNIDKGITNNQALYQPMDLTLRNSENRVYQLHYAMADHVLMTGNYPSGMPSQLSKPHIQNVPRTLENIPFGDWIALSSLSVDPTGDWQSFQDQFNRSQYGDEIASTQIKGDFRNLGHHSFFTPRSLQLKNDEGIKNVSLSRYAWNPDDPITEFVDEEAVSYAHSSIKLYRKEGGARGYYDAYNKFTDNNKPYYTQETATHNLKDPFGTYEDLVPTDYLKYLHSPHKNILAFNRLQVSPNYHGGLKTPGNKKVFWIYRGRAEMILEDPTKIEMMWGRYNIPKVNWDDSKTPYPIPMEYVSDLIQRVVQIEVQTELKTIPDVITDGQDDLTKLKMKGGAQVQR